jgi:hypothetical protein
MSVRLNYENNNSELIEHLPVINTPIDPVDYAKIAPLLDETSKAFYPLRKYIIVFILYIIFSLSSVNSLIIGITPSVFKGHEYAILIFKSIMFVCLIFILDNIIR